MAGVKVRATISIPYRRTSVTRATCGPRVEFVFNDQVLWSNEDQSHFDAEGTVLGEVEFFTLQNAPFSYEERSTLPASCNGIDVVVWDPMVTIVPISDSIMMVDNN